MGGPAPLGEGTTSPFEPPKADDRTFVVNDGEDLDTGCTYRSGGPLFFSIPVTRYAGPTKYDGTLKDAAKLVSKGLLERYALLIMPAFDVDFNAETEPPAQPERDRVYFNGTPVKALYPHNSEFLRGDNEVWRLNEFLIPIEAVKFPNKRGTGGNAPTPAMNEIRIDIDVKNSEEMWCTAIDWAVLKIKVMSPIILIHGNNSNGDHINEYGEFKEGFFRRRGFTLGLTAQNLLWDNSVNMPTSTRAANAVRLNQLIPPIVKSFGVDSVHLVAHSKGGLDTREYLATLQPGHDAEFKVLSYTSLSTPHNGTVAADVGVTRALAARRASKVEFDGFPEMANLLAYLNGVDDGMLYLQTTTCAAFNAGNLPRLPEKTVYNAVAADADRSGNSAIDNVPDEYMKLRAESETLTEVYDWSIDAAREIVDTLYQVLRNTSGVTVAYERRGIWPDRYTVATVSAVPNYDPLGNDTLVTIPSGLGEGTLEHKTTYTRTFSGAGQFPARDHSSVANGGVANVVGPWLIDVEKAYGDLN